MKTYAPVTEAVLDALKTIVGAEYVLTEPEKLEQYQTDEETDPAQVPSAGGGCSAEGRAGDRGCYQAGQYI